MTRTRMTWSLACLFAAGLLIASLGTACKAEKEEVAEPGEKLAISADTLIPIMGQGEGSRSGVLDATMDESGLTVSYYLYIENKDEFAEKIGADLAPKLKELYAEYENIDRAQFTINIPAEAEPAWRPYASFVITRKIMKETDWTALLNVDFLKVVEDLKYFD
jgi:hypothetical protein